MIRTLIIEDETASYNNLKQILDSEYSSSISVLGHATGVISGIKLIEELNPELIFLDIQIEDGTGFDLLDYFSDSSTFEVIFTTGLRDYKEKAMDYFAFYYLNKPIDKEQLKHVIDRFLSKKTAFNIEKYTNFKNQLENKSKKIALPTTNGDFILIDLEELIYCEADGSYTHFYTTTNKKYTSSNNLKKVENILNHTAFFRIHRSTLINLKHINKFNASGEINLTNNVKLTVSVRNKGQFLKALKLMNYTVN